MPIWLTTQLPDEKEETFFVFLDNTALLGRS